MARKLTVVKNTEKAVQPIRFTVQILFVLLCLWIGVEFFLFIRYFETNGATAFVARPPGVDGFLPISSMMNAYYFLLTGDIHNAHPAGFFIFLAIVAVSLAFGKAFCSWLCPVGFLSEMVGEFGEKVTKKLFKRKLTVPKFLDYPLRSLKYLLLLFFVYAIFFAMTALSLKFFLDTPYNLVSDVKMYYFFAQISPLALWIIVILFVVSIFIRNFWCRYLCPYGALLGLTGLLSPFKIKRNSTTCIDCSLCTKACPNNIKVEKVRFVISDECTSCLSCVDACPVADTLDVTLMGKKKFPKRYVAAGVIMIFLLVTGIGMVTGNWQNTISKEEYKILIEKRNSFGHPTGTAEIEELNRESEAGAKDGGK